VQRSQAEADVAAGLFLELSAFCEAARKRGQQVPEYEVGVVTPYRQQKACLRETFERMAGPAATSKVPLHFLRPFREAFTTKDLVQQKACLLRQSCT